MYRRTEKEAGEGRNGQMKGMNGESLRPLFFLQEKLDERIKSGIQDADEIMEEITEWKVLSFRVELAELLNETRYHKFWSTKQGKFKGDELEEYVDALHFLLSIGGDKKIKDYTYRGLYDGEFGEEHIRWLFEKLFTIPWTDLRRDDYKLGLEMYLKLGELLGFTWEDIKSGYARKNIINHERQEAGY